MIVDLTAYSKPASAGSIGFAGAAGAGLEGAWEAVAEGEASAACGASADGWAGAAAGGRINLTNYRSGALNRRWGGRGDRGRARAVRLGRCWRGNDVLDGGPGADGLATATAPVPLSHSAARAASSSPAQRIAWPASAHDTASERALPARETARPAGSLHRGGPSLDGSPGIAASSFVFGRSSICRASRIRPS